MNRSRANRRILVVVMVGALVVLGGVTGKLAPIRWVFDHTIAPLAAGFSAAGASTGEALSNLGRVSALARDNTRLEHENADLRQRLTADAETQHDNEVLRRQLGLDVAGGLHQVAAEVVLFSPDSYRQFVSINKASLQFTRRRCISRMKPSCSTMKGHSYG